MRLRDHNLLAGLLLAIIVAIGFGCSDETAGTSGEGTNGDGGTEPTGVSMLLLSGGDTLSIAIPDSAISATRNELGEYSLVASHDEAGANLFYNFSFGFLLPAESADTMLLVNTTPDPGEAKFAFTEILFELAGTLDLDSGYMVISDTSNHRLTGAFEFAGDLVGERTGLRTARSGRIDVSVTSR